MNVEYLILDVDGKLEPDPNGNLLSRADHIAAMKEKDRRISQLENLRVLNAVLHICASEQAMIVSENNRLRLDVADKDEDIEKLRVHYVRVKDACYKLEDEIQEHEEDWARKCAELLAVIKERDALQARIDGGVKRYYDSSDFEIYRESINGLTNGRFIFDQPEPKNET